MYHDLKKNFKKDIMMFMDKCLNYQYVKYVHQRLGAEMPRIPIPEYKYKCINRDFIASVHLTLGKFYYVSVIMGQLTKATQYFHMRASYYVVTLSKIYIMRIV